MVKQGEIYALDFAPRVVRDLIFIAQERVNVAPLMADANQPQTYREFVPDVDVVFMDIAQRNQVEIFTKNIGLLIDRRNKRTIIFYILGSWFKW